MQEVSSIGLNSGRLTLTSQEPDQWEPETDDEAGIGEDEEVVLIIIFKGSPPFKKYQNPHPSICEILFPISPCKFCIQQKQICFKNYI